jgi:hypothetical protein
VTIEEAPLGHPEKPDGCSRFQRSVLTIAQFLFHLPVNELHSIDE